MAVEIIDVPQKSPEWYEARMGIPTASMFHAVLARGEGKTRRSYMIKLAGEKITGKPMENYSNDDMDRGTAEEPEIRERYAFIYSADIKPAGFIKNGRKGCSPDGLIGDDGMVEIKSAAPHVLIDILLNGVPPSKHVPQCLGGLWVAERKWLDLVIGSSPELPLFVHRFQRDRDYDKRLSAEIDAFNGELVQMVQQIRRMT